MGLEVCVLASGSSGNATYVSSGSTRLLLDCGVAARVIVERLAELGVSPRELDGILISHAHLDHFRSAGTLHARYGVRVFTRPATLRAIDRKASCGSFWRVRECRRIPEGLGDITIRTFDVPHGGRETGEPVGFVLESGGRRLGHLTDCGEAGPRIVEALRGLHGVVIEANYHRPTLLRKLEDPAFADLWPYLRWVDGPRGHLSNQQCARLLRRTLTAEATAVFLAHISENHHDPRRDNNDFETARGVVTRAIEETGLRTPLHRTYRRGRREGRRSELVGV
ncbi:MAG: MBL fold metallo-hydrolase [Thermoplasmatota archaeon]